MYEPFAANCMGIPDCMRLFFFQAEDGIRGKLVTGVQTCALPIFVRRLRLIATVVFAVLLLSAQGASALQDDGVIEHMSGPGPFLRWPSLQVRVACFTREIGRASCRERVEISVRAL